MIWPQISIEIFGINFGYSILNINDWDKKNANTIKSSLEKSEIFFEREKGNRQTNSSIKTLAYNSKIYLSEIPQK